MDYNEKLSNSKAQSAFPLATTCSKKTIIFEAGKGKGSRKQKKNNIHITNRITKFLVPSFNKYSRNEITKRYEQCRRQTKRSERALAENGGDYKTELLHVKTDILKLQFCIHL